MIPMAGKSMIPLFKVAVSSDAGRFMTETLHSGFIGEGPLVKQFEGLLAGTFKTPHVLALNSATSGLELAADMLMGERSYGYSKLHTTALTCVATNWPFVRRDFRMDWIDVDPDTLNMDLDCLRSRVDEYSAGVVLTHWAGRSHDMEAVESLQQDFLGQFGRPLPIIEDCAHAFGGSYKGKALGTFGDFGVYSFQAVKPLTTCDGGCIISRLVEDHEILKKARWYGIDRDNRDADIENPGYKYHMNDLSASLGLANYEYACSNVDKAKSNAEFYDKELIDIPDVRLLARPGSDVVHPYYLYTMLVERRSDFVRAMKDRGVETGLVHPRNDVHSCVQLDRCDLPNLDRISDKVVNIPVGWWVSESDRSYIRDAILSGW